MEQKKLSYPRSRSKHKYRTRPRTVGNSRNVFANKDKNISIDSYRYRNDYDRIDENQKTSRLIVKLVVSIAIILAVVILKNINVPFTQKIVDKISTAVTEDFDFDQAVGKLKFVTDYLPDVKSVFMESQSKSSYPDDKQSDQTGNKTGTDEAERTIIPPVEGKVIKFFGKPYNGELMNNGIDIKCDSKDVIFSVADGMVKEISSDAEWGQKIRIDHGNGLESIYVGVTDIKVSTSNNVEQGEEIAYLKSDDSGEYILHFEVWENGKPIDPLSIIKAQNKVVQ